MILLLINCRSIYATRCEITLSNRTEMLLNLCFENQIIHNKLHFRPDSSEPLHLIHWSNLHFLILDWCNRFGHISFLMYGFCLGIFQFFQKSFRRRNGRKQFSTLLFYDNIQYKALYFYCAYCIRHPKKWDCGF